MRDTGISTGDWIQACNDALGTFRRMEQDNRHVRGCSDEDLKLLQHHIETARHHAEQICQTLQLPSSLRPCVLHIYRAASEITGVEELRLLQAQLSTLFPNEDLGTNAAASEVHMIPELSLGDVLDRSLLPQQEQELNVPRQVSSSQAGTSIAAGDLSQVQSWPVPSLPARADSGATSTSLVVEGSSDEQQPEPCWLRPRTSIDTGSDILGAQHTHSVHTTEPPRGAPWTSNKAHGHLVGPAVRRAHGSHGHGSQGHHASHSHYSTTAAARSFSSPLQREMSVVEDPAARESSQLTSSTMASTWHTLREASTDVHAHHGGMRRLRSHDFAGAESVFHLSSQPRMVSSTADSESYTVPSFVSSFADTHALESVKSAEHRRISNEELEPMPPSLPDAASLSSVPTCSGNETGDINGIHRVDQSVSHSSHVGTSTGHHLHRNPSGRFSNGRAFPPSVSVAWRPKTLATHSESGTARRQLRVTGEYAHAPQSASGERVSRMVAVLRPSGSSSDDKKVYPEVPSAGCTCTGESTPLSAACTKYLQRRQQLEDSQSRSEHIDNELTPGNATIALTMLPALPDPGPAEYNSPRPYGASTSLGSAFDEAATDGNGDDHPLTPRSPMAPERQQSDGNSAVVVGASGLPVGRSWGAEPLMYTEAIQNALAGRGTAVAPYLDGRNNGTEEYFGSRVLGSYGRAGKMPAPPVGLIGMRRAMESDAIFPEVTWRATPPDGVFESRNEEQQLQGGSAVYPQPPIHGDVLDTTTTLADVVDDEEGADVIIREQLLPHEETSLVDFTERLGLT